MITAIDKKAALVLIDLQKGIVKGQKAHPVNEILEKAALLAAAFRKKRLPVVVVHVDPIGAAWTMTRTEISSAPKNPIVQAIARLVLPLTGFTKIVPRLQLQPADIRITKKTWNAFYNTPLHSTLQQLGITQVVLSGISTSIGVEGTARAAAELGYTLAFAIDAMTDKSAEAHNNSLDHIFPRLGELGTAAEIIHFL